MGRIVSSSGVCIFQVGLDDDLFSGDFNNDNVDDDDSAMIAIKIPDPSLPNHLV